MFLARPVTKLGATLEMIKFEHSVFALPFALVGALLAARQTAALHGLTLSWPPAAGLLRALLWIVVAMVAARSAAMTVNRIADIRYDRENPRTSQRALPTGALSLRFALFFSIVASAIFIFAAWSLNPLAFALSPLTLLILFSYSWTKRFTSFSHLILGFCLGISPAAAWIAVRGSLDLRMLLLCAAVTLWVAGFDVLYACQDADFDRRAGLFSIPNAVGIPAALCIARFMHALMILLLVWLALDFRLGLAAWIGIALVALLLAWEHSLVKPNDLSKMNAAFFTVNGYISLVFLLFWGTAAIVTHP
jgi:4-hydroxybenzoate polyprenyltransferase